MANFVYILANKKGGALYVGSSKDPKRRSTDHAKGRGAKFTRKYHVYKLVYVEEHSDIKTAMKRERSLKRWRRQWKIELIEKNNPEWKELVE